MMFITILIKCRTQSGGRAFGPGDHQGRLRPLRRHEAQHGEATTHTVLNS